MIVSQHVPWTAAEEQHMTTTMAIARRRTTVEDRIAAVR
jgi:hypothetical protein